MKCVAIDDEPLALRLLSQYIAKFPSLELVQTFDDAIEGADFLNKNQVDLLFIDINMPDLTGLELVAFLKNKPIVIFTTAHKKFAFEGFELNAIDYLLKPIDFERFSRAVEKASDHFLAKNISKEEVPESIFVRSEYKIVKIDLPEIEYIESLEDYIKIHLTGTKPVLTLMSMKSVLEKLPAARFSRIHRSYIVPHNQVKSVVNKKVQLSSGKELPISDSYAGFVEEWMKR